MRGVQNVKLASHLLEPEPREIVIHLPGQCRTKTTEQHNRVEWSGDASRYATATVTVGEATSPAKRARKEIPLWLRKSTVIVDEHSSVSPEEDRLSPLTQTASAQSVLDTLLLHEKWSDAGDGVGSEGGGAAEWEAVPEETFVVSVAGEHVAIHNITQDLVDKMSTNEKRHYIALAQQLYAALYE